MTDFIEQMMETAGVNKIIKRYEIPARVAGFRDELIYPGFTAEKQLEIIKLIADSDNGAGGIGIFKIADDYYCTPECYWQIGKRATTNTDFTQALAQLTTELMKAGELDKEKVNELLQ